MFDSPTTCLLLISPRREWIQNVTIVPTTNEPFAELKTTQPEKTLGFLADRSYLHVDNVGALCQDF